MNWIYPLLLGIVQALTEFLPVSSSGHLVVFQEALRIQEASHAFDALLHLGTALATICFYWKRIWEIVRGSWKWTLNFLRRGGPADEASRDAIELAALIVLCTIITGALRDATGSFEPGFVLFSIFCWTLVAAGVLLPETGRRGQ